MMLLVGGGECAVTRPFISEIAVLLTQYIASHYYIQYKCTKDIRPRQSCVQKATNLRPLAASWADTGASCGQFANKIQLSKSSIHSLQVIYSQLSHRGHIIMEHTRFRVGATCTTISCLPC